MKNEKNGLRGETRKDVWLTSNLSTIGERALLLCTQKWNGPTLNRICKALLWFSVGFPQELVGPISTTSVHWDLWGPWENEDHIVERKTWEQEASLFEGWFSCWPGQEVPHWRFSFSLVNNCLSIVRAINASRLSGKSRGTSWSFIVGDRPQRKNLIVQMCSTHSKLRVWNSMAYSETLLFPWRWPIGVCAASLSGNYKPMTCDSTPPQPKPLLCQ